MTKKKIDVSEIKEATKPEVKVERPKITLNSGSTLINLMLSNDVNGGYEPGYHLWWGTSRSGKSLLTLQALAEAANSDKFAEYALYHNDTERGAGQGLRALFGNKATERILPPFMDEDGNWGSSTLIEDFFCDLDDKLQEDAPFIYVLDSFDALTTNAEDKEFKDTKKALRAGKQISGTFGVSKAKAFSVNMRRIPAPLLDKNSYLFGISQAKDNLSFGFEKHSRAGGTALRYYANSELLVDIVGAIKKTVAGTARHIGNRVKVSVKKNRQTGSSNSVEISIYDGFGVDDIGDMIYYLTETEEHWTKTGQKINVPEWDIKVTFDKLVQHIENNGLEDDLKQIVQKLWDDIREKASLKRKKRYE